MSNPESQAQLENYISKVLDYLDIDAVIEVEALGDEDRNYFSINISTEDEGPTLIGRYGSMLESMTTLLNLLMEDREAESWRVVVDVNGYRAERTSYIEELAEKTIARVINTGQTFELDPMKAWERRIVHMRVGNYPELVSRSEGQGLERRVIIEMI